MNDGFDECETPLEVGVWLNAANFLILSILLIATVIPLFKALSSLASGQMQLSHGVKMLSAVFGLFTFCYVTRSIYDVTISPTLDFPNLFSGTCLPLLWDFIPILLMFTYHF